MKKFAFVKFFASSPIGRYENPLVAEDIVQFLWQLIIILFTISLYLAPLMIIIGAYIIITSGGAPSRVDKGKKIIIWTLVGLTIMLVSRGIIYFVWLVMSG